MNVLDKGDEVKNIFARISAFFKRLGRRRFENIAILSAALLVVADFGYHAVTGFSSSVETIPARVGTVEQTIESEAYVVRDETLIYADMTGSVIAYAENGGKVKESDAVAGVYYHSVGQELADSLEELRRTKNIIEQAEQARDDKVSALINGRITALTAEISELLASGELKASRALNASLQYLLTYREIHGGRADISALLAGLEERIEELESDMGSPAETVLSPGAGWFYSDTDGYESIADPDSLAEMNFSEMAELFDADSEDYSQGAPDGSAPSDGSDAPDADYSTPCVVGKLVNSHVRYTVSIVSSEQATALSTSRSYTAYLDGTQTTLTLERTLLSADGQSTALVFSCDNTETDDPLTRIYDLSIVTGSYSGFRIPTRAITYIDGICGVYILRGFTVEFREVSVLGSADNMIIADVSPSDTSGEYRVLARNDNIIVGGNNLYVGKIIR